jgi:hypothetical protein
MTTRNRVRSCNSSLGGGCIRRPPPAIASLTWTIAPVDELSCAGLFHWPNRLRTISRLVAMNTTFPCERRLGPEATENWLVMDWERREHGTADCLLASGLATPRPRNERHGAVLKAEAQAFWVRHTVRKVCRLIPYCVPPHGILDLPTQPLPYCKYFPCSRQTTCNRPRRGLSGAPAALCPPLRILMQIITLEARNPSLVYQDPPTCRLPPSLIPGIQVTNGTYIWSCIPRPRPRGSGLAWPGHIALLFIPLSFPRQR